MENLYRALRRMDEEKKSYIEKLDLIGQRAKGNPLLTGRIVDGIPLSNRFHVGCFGIRINYLIDEVPASNASDMTDLVEYRVNSDSPIGGIASFIEGMALGTVGSALAGCTGGNAYCAIGAGALGLAIPIARNISRIRSSYLRLDEQVSYLDETITKLGLDDASRDRHLGKLLTGLISSRPSRSPSSRSDALAHQTE